MGDPYALLCHLPHMADNEVRQLFLLYIVNHRTAIRKGSVLRCNSCAGEMQRRGGRHRLSSAFWLSFVFFEQGKHWVMPASCQSGTETQLDFPPQTDFPIDKQNSKKRRVLRAVNRDVGGRGDESSDGIKAKI